MRNFPRTDGGRPVGASQQPATSRSLSCESAENTFARDSNTQKHERTMQSALSGSSNGGVGGSPQWVINVIARCVRRAASTAAARIFINAPVCAVHADCTSTRRVSRLHTWIMLPLCTRVHDQQRMCVTLRWLLLDLCASANSEKNMRALMLFASGSQRASREPRLLHFHTD